MDEIIKHTRKITKTFFKKDSSISGKIKEIVLEIFIIVFAISLSQFLERKREESVKLSEVKEFLLGLKEDMADDVKQSKDNLKNYDQLKEVYTYLYNIDPDRRPNPDSLNRYISALASNGYLRPNISLFEGFKSSGKLEEIENKTLLRDILIYYEQAIPQLTSSTEPSWLSRQNILGEIFIKDKVERKDGTNNNYELITRPEAKNLCKALIPWPEIYKRYNKILTLEKKIIDEIDKEYPQ